MKKLLAILLTFCALAAAAQEYITPVKNDLMPPTPQSWKPVEYQMPQPSMLTGAVDLSIPIYTITAGDYSLPIYMQYHSNGIKVTDDPEPYGYGWTLMPALRATRTIMGRPDEHYPFMAYPTEIIDRFRCVASPTAARQAETQQCDSQHDIMTFSLPGKTVTAILDCSSGQPEFVTFSGEEYRIKASDKLDTLEILDPYGIKYIFGGPCEFQSDVNGITGSVPTTWALKKIIVSNIETIELHWTTRPSSYSNFGLLGGISFIDKAQQYRYWDNGVTYDNYLVDDGQSANYAPYPFNNQILVLDSINFPGGVVDIKLKDNYIKEINVSNGSEVIKSAKFTYKYKNYSKLLLTSVNLSDEGLYSFAYKYEKEFTSSSGQDWWGFFNGTSPSAHTPSMRIKQYYDVFDERGSYASFPCADKSINVDSMQVNLLAKVIYPTGGFSEFEYEPHEFKPTREAGGENEIDPLFNPYLSRGGGVRVSKITMATGTDDNQPKTIQYKYKKANVRAVPSAATFIDITNGCRPLGGISLSRQGHDIFRSVHINISSGYMRYDIGEEPLWYDTVTAIYPEGKIEYVHSDLMKDEHNTFKKGFGFRSIAGIRRAFSSGYQLVEKNTYMQTASGYRKVESEKFAYEVQNGYKTLPNCHVVRNTIQIDSWVSPDFIRGEWLDSIYMNDKIQEPAYDINLYTIAPYRERLARKTKIVYTPRVAEPDSTDSIVSKECYSYKGKTSLISSVTRTTSDGADNVITVAYPSASGTGIENDMVKANVIGKPVSETLTHGRATVKHSADYVQVNGNFAVTQASTTFGASADTLLSPKHSYIWFGRPMTTTDADGISTSWLWGHFGSYLIYKVNGYTIEELVASNGTGMYSPNAQDLQTAPSKGLISKVLYKTLVGPTSVTTPNGLTTHYSYYSGNNRLYEVRRENTLLQRFQYLISQREENYVQVNDFINDNQAHIVVSYYDGLGRESRVRDAITEITTHKTYDNMGRLARVSVPQVDDPDSYAWTLNGYEASPRNMLIMKTLPGQLWHTQKKSSKIAIYTNTEKGAYSCYRLTVGGNDSVASRGLYAPGTLMIEETTDEDGYISRMFTDLEGKVVMTGEGRGTDIYYTRNVYDEYGRLRYVLPPSISIGLRNIIATSGTLSKYAFIYKYDSRGRLVYTKTPGCTAEEIVYSPAGRVVARHTPAMASGKWILYFYDRYGREVEQQLATMSNTYLENLRKKLYIFEYSGASTNGGYKCTGALDIPTGTMLKATYYDNYEFAKSADSDLAGTGSQASAKGLLTGVLDYTASSAGLASVTLYNSDGFVAAVNSRMLNGKQLRTFTTDRRGKVLTEREVFTASSGKTYVRVTTNTYDKAERLISSTVVENGKTAKIERSYGKNGLLSLETFGNKLKRSYTYDIHGWLTKSHLTSLNSIMGTNASAESDEYYSPLAVGGTIIRPPALNIVNLTEQILYTEGATPLYSGCPSAKNMISGGRYDYTFDNHRRLIRADFTSAFPDSTENYSTEYMYDYVANPQYVKRKGIINLNTKGEATYGILDELGYSYEGNQVTHIEQLNQGVDFYGRTGYAPESGTYTWNAAGLLLSDSSRGILSTTYNHLGLPVNQGYKTENNTIAVNYYTYSADGALLAITNFANNTKRYYSGSRIFNATDLEYSYFPGGYFDSAGNPHYTHADYQGSIIAVTDSAGTVVQTTNYYPYGEPWREPTGQPMLFGGKERTALNDYRYGPRSLMSAALLWDRYDNNAHSYTRLSPFSFCGGNPIANFELDGNDWVERNDGSMIWLHSVTADNYQQVLRRGDTYRGKEYTRYIDEGDSHDNIVQEHYLPNGEVQSETHQGEFQMDFDGEVIPAEELTGKHNVNKAIVGTAYINAVFSDGSLYTAMEFPFTSGPYGNGPLANNTYSAYNFSAADNEGMFIPGTNEGWKVYLNDYNDRNGLRIHPDGNSVGTAGCIGILGTVNELKGLGDFFKNQIKIKGKIIKVNFQIPNNPNYGNQGLYKATIHQ